MPRKKKATHGPKFDPAKRDTVTLPSSHYQPTKAELEEEFSFCKDTGTKPEDWGATEEEQIRNMTAYLL